MRCEQARLELWPKPGPRATSADNAEALAHFAECPSCQRFFRIQGDLTTRLARLSAISAPAALRPRVLATLDETELTTTTGRRAGWLAGTGVALLAAAAVILLLVSREPEPAVLATPLVAQAQLVLDDPRGITSSSIEDIERWFEATMGQEVGVPNITNAAVLAGRVTAFDGAPAAAVVYLYRGTPLTYFALAQGKVMGVTLPGDQLLALSADGYEVALWTEDGKARAVVAKMPRADVMDVAKECRSKALMRVS